MMSKRIISSVLGVLAFFAGLLATVFTIEGFEDFRTPAVSFGVAAIGEILMGSTALTGLGMGIRFLRFAWRGRDERNSSWLRPALLGIGCFFPAVLLSLPLTILWARHTWPGDGQKYFAALQVSLCIGLAAAIVGCAVLLKKRHTAWSLGK
jgi:hypothetical protein